MHALCRRTFPEGRIFCHDMDHLTDSSRRRLNNRINDYLTERLRNVFGNDYALIADRVDQFLNEFDNWKDLRLAVRQEINFIKIVRRKSGGIQLGQNKSGIITNALKCSKFNSNCVQSRNAITRFTYDWQPAEIAPCYVFLASKESSFITGQVLHPNGGVTVNT